ncbi:MAG: hypothetical protein EXR75_05675 [Myxococcales bacterium]|nr:hypothetical protein [Myxococcales bacterium]
MTRDKEGPPEGPAAPQSLGVMFDCCNVYRRVFKRADGTAYEGRCPKCGRAVCLVVGPGGSGSRVWRAT